MNNKMNPTRKFLLDRAAAVVAQLQDPGEQPLTPEQRAALVSEYRDLRHALACMHRADVPTADNAVPLGDSLWADHCSLHGLDPEHDGFNL